MSESDGYSVATISDLRAQGAAGSDTTTLTVSQDSGPSTSGSSTGAQAAKATPVRALSMGPSLREGATHTPTTRDRADKSRSPSGRTPSTGDSFAMVEDLGRGRPEKEKRGESDYGPAVSQPRSKSSRPPSPVIAGLSSGRDGGLPPPSFAAPN